MIFDTFSVLPWTALKHAATRRKALHTSITRHFALKYPRPFRMEDTTYVSTLDAEPLHRYKKGGYHPVALGDTLKDGRYKVLHKLGWGGYSTVWAARDQRSVLIYFTTLLEKLTGFQRGQLRCCQNICFTK
jgi:hypothetical protein